MKKLVSLLMILVLSLSLAACSKNKPSDTNQPDNTAVTATPAATATPTANPTGTPTPVPVDPTEAPTPEPTAEPTPEPTEIPVAEELTIEVSTVKVDREDFNEADLAVSYDTMTVVNPGYDALKATLEELVDSHSENIVAFAEGYLPDMVYVDDELICFLENSISLHRVDDDVVSVSFNYSSYLGGAHPSYYVYSYNIDTKTGKIINITDLFGDSVYTAEWAAFSTALFYELANYEGAEGFFFDYKDTVNNILSEENANSQLIWFYEKDSITVLFDQYVVAPYAAGTIVVSIPFENGVISYPEKTDAELLSELSREWNIFYSEVDGYGEVFGLEKDIWDTTDIATFTINPDSTCTFTRSGEIIFENAPITFDSWMATYYADPNTTAFDIDYTDGQNYFYGTYDGENVYLTQEIESDDYHVAVYMVMVPGEPIYHEAFASVISYNESDAIISLKEYITLLSWDDPDYLATFGVTENDFLDDTLRYVYADPARTFTIDSWYPPILMNFNYETMEQYSASYDEFMQNLQGKWAWNDEYGAPVHYVNGRYGPVYIAETYSE